MFANHNGILVAEFPKSHRENWRVYLLKSGNRETVVIRAFFRSEDGGSRPGQQGLDMRGDHFAAVVKSVQQQGGPHERGGSF
jgi:hypothetical protein